MKNLKRFSHFCKNFQGKFFFKGQHLFSTKNCTNLHKSLPSRIFLNSYPIKAHCEYENCYENYGPTDTAWCRVAYAQLIKEISCTFLDASLHLYMGACPFVRRSVCPSVRPSVRLSFRLSVHLSVCPLCIF